VKVLLGDIEPGFQIDLAHKDLSLALGSASVAKVPLARGAVARECLQLAHHAMLSRPRTLPPGFIAPCLPTSAKQPPAGEIWVHEI
jgi:NAD-binding of NADP-dependent 3-hydroxyisobutyrate dehydrogenase